MTLRYNESKVYNQQIKETDMKKYLFIALAALGFAACTESGDEKTPVQNAEMEESYIAINLMAADNDTRAADGGLDYGTEAERAVKTAYFFFFDANGEPFNVTGAPATAPGGGKNHLPLDITPITGKENTPVENVSDISDAVLILNTYKGAYPSQIVAVLNWVPEDKAYSLNDLHKNLTALVGVDAADGGYVMSNSVYKDGAGKMVDAVPLTTANIKTTPDAAKLAPIDIYVERIAAKVEVTANGEKVASTTHDNVFDTTKDTDFVVFGSSNVDVYVQLHGWELFNDYSDSHLLKNIDTDWTDDALGFPWNNSSYFRCYWTESQTTTLDDKFAWSYQDGESINYGIAVGEHTYCGENTLPVTRDSKGKVMTTSPNTKVILKGQLLQSDGNGGHQPLELASWYGNEYAGEEALRIAVANSLAYTLYHSSNGTNFTPIGKDDIVFDTNVAGTQSYEAGFKLSESGNDKMWYLYSSDGNHQPLGSLSDIDDMTAKTNTYLATNVEPAIIYVNGMTYYIVDIEHLGNTGTTAEYGVVRNHVYQIDINSIKGYGSPVYNGLGFIVEQPEYPEVYEDSYVAARINVLSWKVVQQGVDIVQ